MAMQISKKLRGFQFGLESLNSQGTAVVANRLIKNGTFNNKRMNNIKKASAEGHKSAIGVQRGKRWTEWTLAGALGYNALPYWAAMILLGGVSPSTVVAGSAYSYGFPMSSQNSDVPQTMTFEYGNNQGENSRLAYGTMTDLSIHVNKDTADYSASGFGAYPSKNITMTPNPTVIPTILASMIDFRVNYATNYANLSTGKLLTVKDMTVDVKGKYASQLFMDDATPSIGGILEKQPDITVKLIVAEGTESDFFLGNLENGTLSYLQLQGTGPLLSGSTYNSMKITTALYTSEEEEGDTDDLFTGTYNFYSGEDTVNNDFRIDCVCGLATL